MILEMIIDLLVGLIKLIFGMFTLPALPDGVNSVIDTLFGYMESGIGFVSYICTWSYVQIIIGFVVAVEVGYMVYKLVIWILTKTHILGGE